METKLSTPYKHLLEVGEGMWNIRSELQYESCFICPYFLANVIIKLGSELDVCVWFG